MEEHGHHEMEPMGEEVERVGDVVVSRAPGTPLISRLGDELCARGVAKSGMNFSFICPGHDDITRSEIVFVTPNTPQRSALARTLGHSTLNFTGGPGLGSFLLGFQRECIEHMVYRPQVVVVNRTVVRTNARGHSTTFGTRHEARCGRSDIGTTVVNDLMTGSGKTIATMVASIYFAIHRKQEVVDREEILLREQRPTNWSSRVGANDTPREYSNSVVVMASDKVVAQWEYATSLACTFLGINSDVHRDPPAESASMSTECSSDSTITTNSTTTEAQDSGGGVPSITIYLFTSVMNLTQFFKRDEGFVACIVVDEFTLKSAHNLVTRNAGEAPLYGRLILVSADAGEASTILLGSRRNSLIRSTVAKSDFDTAGLKTDVNLASTLMACSTLPSASRQAAHDFIFSRLNKVVVEKYNLDFSSPIWGTMDGSLVNDYPKHLEPLGISDLMSVRTVGGLVDKIEILIENYESSSDEKGGCVEEYLPGVPGLKSLRDTCLKFLSSQDDCAVCLEPLKSKNKVCIISPCNHIFCKNCTRSCLEARNTCPFCRVEIDGVFDARPGAMSVGNASVMPADVSGCESFQDFLRACLPNEGSVLETCCAILEAASFSALKDKSPVKRLVIMGHSKDFARELEKYFRQYQKTKELPATVKVMRFKVGCNKRKRTMLGYEEQLEYFRRDDESDEGVIKVLCTHENTAFTEDVLGLDLHQVDAICHVGRGVTGRTLGRIARLQRVINPSASRIVRLFNLIPFCN